MAWWVGALDPDPGQVLHGPRDDAVGQRGCQQLQEQRQLSHGKDGKVTEEQLLITRHATGRQEERVSRYRS